MANLRGLESWQEQDQQQIIRDTRTLGQRIADFLKHPKKTAGLLGVVSAAIYVMPYLTDLFFLTGVGFFLYAYVQKPRLPFRMPQRSHLPDYNTPKAGSSRPTVAAGDRKSVV